MKRYKSWIILAVVATFAAAGYFLLTNNETVEVSTMKSYKGSITKTIEVAGTINSSDVEIINIDPGKTVVKTYVKENDLVVKNQLLAELDAEELVISLEKAKLNLEDLNEKLNDAATDNNDLILLENSLSRMKEEYSKISEDLSFAKDDLEKAEVLYEEGVISKLEYDSYVSAVSNLNSKLKTAELNLKDATVNFRDRQEQKSKEKSSLERQIKLLNLDIESLNNKIEDSKIYSKIEGVVTEYPIEEYRETLNGDRITIHNASSYVLTALVSQQDAVFIKEGQKSMVTVDGMNTVYEGVVSFVSSIAVTDNSGSILPKVEIKIRITNPDDNITFGYEGEAKIIIDSQDEVIIVKSESIKREGDKEFVYLLNNDSVKKAYVETGLTDGYLINIKSGINESDVVIVNPPVELSDGTKVKAVE